MLSLRMGIASAVMGVGYLIGSLIVALIIQRSDPSSTYSLGMFLGNIFTFASLIYALFFVRETGRHAKESEGIILPTISVSKFDNFRISAVKNRNLSGICQIVKHRFAEVFRTLTDERIGWTRFCLNLTVAFVFIEFLALGKQRTIG